MADTSLLSFPGISLQPDNQGIIDASDIPAVPVNTSGRRGMQYSDGSDESAAVTPSFVMPTQYDGSADVHVDIHYYGDSAPGGSGGVVFEVAFEAITEADAHDLHSSGDFFASAQSATDTIDSSAGVASVARVTLTNAQADAVQAGDRVRICIRRDSDNGSDTYADVIVIETVELQHA